MDGASDPQPTQGEEESMDIDHDQGRTVMPVALKHSSVCEIAVAVNEDQSEMQESLCQPELDAAQQHTLIRKSAVKS